MIVRARPNGQTGAVLIEGPSERPRQRRLKRPIAGALLGTAMAGVVMGLPSSTLPARADSTVIIDGRGFGHGVGMAQDGAYWLGRSGRSASQILQTFYPGTSLSKRSGAIRVPLAVASGITLRLSGAGSIGGYRIPADTSVTVTTRSGGFRVTLGGATPDTTIPGATADESRTGGATPSTPVPSAPAPGPAPGPVPGPAPAPSGPVAVAVAAPASVGFVASASPARLISQGLRLFRGLRSQADAASQTGVAVAVVAVPAPPAVVVTPVDPNPTTLAEANTVPVTPVFAVPDPGAAPQPTPLPIGDAASGSGGPVNADATPATSPAAGERGGGAKPSSFEIDAERVEVTSSGLLGMGGRRYRGSLELANRSGSVRVVNIVDVEQYLRGMGEILSRDWPAATLQAQAVAARTYAIRMMGTIGEVCPTQACQVYLGAQVEYPQMDAAVAATRGQVVTYKGSLAITFYSASGGGTIADPTEGFGSASSLPYLRAGVYLTGDLKAWTVSMSLGEVARRVGYRGSPSSVAITDVGPSGRAKEVTVYGSSGALRVRGPRFDAALGLRSTFFTFRGTDVGMSPLPAGVGAASAVEVVTPSPSEPAQGALSPTLNQSPFLFGAVRAVESDVATGSEVAAPETVAAEMATVPSVTPAASTTLPTARAKDLPVVSVIDTDETKDAKGPLLLLGGSMTVLLGAGVIRRLVVAKRRRH